MSCFTVLWLNTVLNWILESLVSVWLWTDNRKLYFKNIMAIRYMFSLIIFVTRLKLTALRSIYDFFKLMVLPMQHLTPTRTSRTNPCRRSANDLNRRFSATCSPQRPPGEWARWTPTSLAANPGTTSWTFGSLGLRSGRVWQEWPRACLPYRPLRLHQKGCSRWRDALWKTGGPAWTRTLWMT